MAYDYTLLFFSTTYCCYAGTYSSFTERQSLAALFKRIVHWEKYHQAAFHSLRIPSYMNVEGKKIMSFLLRTAAAPDPPAGQNPALSR